MNERRNPGLDVVRSLAILMVLLSHLTFLLPKDFSKAWDVWRLEIFGYYGVELFFVLSGFLIGRILLRLFAEKVSWRQQGRLLWNFYLRRWYRTLPLYYVILAFNALYWPWLKLADFPAVREPSWRHVVFLQSYSFPAACFFPESWSLAVEEWFYLLTPLLLWGETWLLARRLEQKNKLLVALGALCAAVFFGRMLYVLQVQPSFDLEIRKNVFLRLDSLGLGVLLAWLRLYKEAAFEKLASSRFQGLAYAVLAGTAVYFWQVGWKGWDASFFARTALLDLVSASFCLLLCGCYLRIQKQRLFFTWTSKLAYALYLVHLPIWATLGGVGAAAGLGLWKIAAALAAAYGVAGILYFCLEQPVLRLRPPELLKIPNETKDLAGE